MMESNQPEVNVDELMQKIREDVIKRQNQTYQTKVTNSNIDTPKINWTMNLIEGLLKNAESRAVARTKWPDNLNRFPFNLSRGLQKLLLKILNFIFKDQREVNFNVISALKESVALNRVLIAQLETLRSQLDEYRSVAETQMQRLNEHLNIADTQLQRLYERLSNLDEYKSAIDRRVEELHERSCLVNNNIQEVEAKFNNIVTETNNSIVTVKQRVDAIANQMQKEDSYLKNDLIQQKRLITLFLEQARQRLPEFFNQQQLQTFVQEEQHSLDALYAAFEEEFRGSRELILNRLKVYLPIIAQAKIGTSDTPILDVGCGRGEWLELLRECGYTAQGIDINRVMLEQCRIKGLEVIEADAITYLQSLPDVSLGGVTGFHIIEHLPFEALIKLLIETARVIKPGGLVIFETPNPENIIVGSCNFYSDPTHRNPLFPPTVKFLMEQHGFVNVEILRWREFRIEDNLKFLEADHLLAPTLNPILEIIKSSFFAAPDFAVIGYKA